MISPIHAGAHRQVNILPVGSHSRVSSGVSLILLCLVPSVSRVRSRGRLPDVAEHTTCFARPACLMTITFAFSSAGSASLYTSPEQDIGEVGEPEKDGWKCDITTRHTCSCAPQGLSMRGVAPPCYASGVRLQQGTWVTLSTYQPVDGIELVFFRCASFRTLADMRIEDLLRKSACERL